MKAALLSLAMVGCVFHGRAREWTLSYGRDGLTASLDGKVVFTEKLSRGTPRIEEGRMTFEQRGDTKDAVLLSVAK